MSFVLTSSDYGIAGISPFFICGSFFPSERDDLNSSPDDDIRWTDILSLSSPSKFTLDSYSDGLAEGRGECCREDAVFSRTPNWVKREFMFLTRSL